jgi:hypothetical protein
MMNISIEKDRARIVRATLNRLKNKTGGHYLLVSMPDGDLRTVEVDEGFINDLLFQLEAEACRQHGKAKGEAMLAETYSEAVAIGKSNEHLTDYGKEIIDGLFEKKIKSIKAKYRTEVKNGE